LATIYCDTGEKSNHILGEEQILMVVPYATRLERVICPRIHVVAECILEFQMLPVITNRFNESVNTVKQA
jgi:hypothetical protein